MVGNTKSVEQTFKRALVESHIAPLFRCLPKKPAVNTVEEYSLVLPNGEERRVAEQIGFIATHMSDGDTEAEGCSRLLTELERQTIMGTTANGGFRGAVALARLCEEMSGEQSVYDDSTIEAWRQRVKRDRDLLGPDFRVFTSHRAQAVTEGSLPDEGDALLAMATTRPGLEWHQLLPCTRIQIAEHGAALSISGPGLQTPSFDRACLVVYGYLRVLDARGFYVFKRS